MSHPYYCYVFLTGCSILLMKSMDNKCGKLSGWLLDYKFNLHSKQLQVKNHDFVRVRVYPRVIRLMHNLQRKVFEKITHGFLHILSSLMYNYLNCNAMNLLCRVYKSLLCKVYFIVGLLLVNKMDLRINVLKYCQIFGYSSLQLLPLFQLSYNLCLGVISPKWFFVQGIICAGRLTF